MSDIDLIDDTVVTNYYQRRVDTREALLQAAQEWADRGGNAEVKLKQAVAEYRAARSVDAYGNPIVMRVTE